MDTKLIFIVAAIALIFALEGVFPYYRGRTARVRHAVPHVITAILNGLLTRFFLSGLTIAAIAWADSTCPRLRLCTGETMVITRSSINLVSAGVR